MTGKGLNNSIIQLILDMTGKGSCPESGKYEVNKKYLRLPRSKSSSPALAWLA
jgi:hypothetical protein